MKRKNAGRLTVRRHEGASWGARNILYLGLSGGCLRICVCKYSLSYTLKIVYFTVCKLYLKERERGREFRISRSWFAFT